MMNIQTSIYLASASPRRHEILLQMGVPHTVLDVPAPPGEDEPRLPGEHPADYVRRTAREKALRAVAWVAGQALPPQAILAADTTVFLGEEILGKPVDDRDAQRMLKRLSGTTHSVHTAVVLAWQNRLDEAVSMTEVRMKSLSDAEIAAYCATGEPMGKAGAYGIQGQAALFIERICGSHSGVVGLPIFETGLLLQRMAAQYMAPGH